MMIVLNKYGVTLRRLTEDKIELVRRWRNDPKIQQYMEYREYITSEMQRSWFNKINNDNNYYFIIEWNGNEVGLINLKDYDPISSSAETGIFIWDDASLNGMVSYKATYCMHDWAYYVLGLKKITAHILNDNIRCQRFTQKQGYKIEPYQENYYNQQYTLSLEDYEKAKNDNKWRLE